MENQKIENLLNLAIDATEEERRKSSVLEIGFDEFDREWELIIKYSGGLEKVRELSSRVTELLTEYAVITIRESLIEKLAELPEVEYVEKPKRLYFQAVNAKRVSCINEVQDARFSLYGQGVLIAIVDSGIDYTLSEFRRPDGSTKIRYFWDQSIESGRPPEGYQRGSEYTGEEIDRAIRANSEKGRREQISSVDVSGHGTAVAGIAVSVAPQSDMIVVKLGNAGKDGFPRTTELMEAVDYVIRKAISLGMPVSVNISFGNSYGPHNGQALVERYLDSVSGLGRTCIVVGAGNEGRGTGHASGELQPGQEKRTELAVQDLEPGLNVQIWKTYTDEVEISLITPSGERIGPFREVLGAQRFFAGQTEILLYYGKPSPYSTRQEIFIDFIPKETYITSGIWQIVLKGQKVVDGRYDLWLPGSSSLNIGTGFTRPSVQVTLTIPSTAARVITVGAYDALTFAYADFSGRGSLISPGFWDIAKPDLAAPGVDLVTVEPGGGHVRVTGTSFAVPIVTGSAALLMEWGIIRGNDLFLYGEKVKAYLRRGAKKLPGFTDYPNNQVGYGALCLRDSIPEFRLG